MATPPASSYPDALIPNLSEDADQSEAQFTVTIDGVTLGALPDGRGRARCLRAARVRLHRQPGRRSAWRLGQGVPVSSPGKPTGPARPRPDRPHGPVGHRG